ncbi:hypothetical protein SAMN05444682_115146 [Parapedobacter indicus]|uniref:Uncharacterized protein n=1 Tax=Parapedobacter indicus TaxID=1477437 RepID=A0A1I3V019_9SPHI|nr:hypothetical protein CLV26_11531 [Parapedobacter indicus]SFJ89024.1 hypothetical protein SAMN05444682_115146 [Parapedobacter indicus]
MKARRKRAAKALLDIANDYEVKQRKFLRNIRFTETSAHWSGQAHDYSVAL